MSRNYLDIILPSHEDSFTMEKVRCPNAAVNETF